MSTLTGQAGSSQGLPALPALLRFILRLVVIAVVDVFMLWLAIGSAEDGNWFLAVAIVLTTLTISIINLLPGLAPVRWISPALALMGLLAIYPLFYTVYVAFTNYSDGHRYTKTETLDLLADRKYLPEGAANYTWTPFQNEAGDFGLWLVNVEGEMFFTAPGEQLRSVDPADTDSGIPDAFEDYRQLTGGDRFRALETLQTLTFGTDENPIGIKGRSEAGDFQQRWVFDEATDVLMDRETNTPYAANDDTGEFIAPDGTVAPLGYWVPIGLDNFRRIWDSATSSGPLLRVFLWTLGYAFFGVLTAFAMGLFMAVILNTDFKGVRVVRSLLLIPWAIPGMIGILIWRGMLNSNVGIIPNTMRDLFGWSPPFLTDAMWAKIAVLLVNLWFAYPYFMLICSGALQSISASIYEAAEVDGATPWNKFWSLTLPLILVSMGPLLIASFIFNFNNYLLLEALNDGGPQMVGTAAPPVGHTDNLMTYTFSHAFSSSGTRNFGFAAAIAVVIFFIVGTLTLIQFRLTRRWEEIGENV